MKYGTVQIKPEAFTEFGWVITLFPPQGPDRLPPSEKNPVGPHSWGFYHFPETLTMEEAFDELKTSMIKNRTDIIDKMKAEIKSLQELEYPGKKT